MSEYEDEKPSKPSQIGPWIESSDQVKVEKSPATDPHQSHYHNFLNSIKYSKKSHRKRSSLQEELKK